MRTVEKCHRIHTGMHECPVFARTLMTAISPSESSLLMDTVLVPAADAVRQIQTALSVHFPTTVFAVRLEDSLLNKEDVCGVDVIWVEGPTRDQVEDVLDRFQGVRWDPRSGELDGRSHYMVSEDGRLIQVYYNVDYIFCDGPATAILEP